MHTISSCNASYVHGVSTCNEVRLCNRVVGVDEVNVMDE